MKKLLILLFFVLCSDLNSQSLSDYASALKEKQPKIYNTIRTMAVEEWGDNHQMILFQINEQVKAMIDVTQKPDLDMQILFKAMKNWSDNPQKITELVLEEKVNELFQQRMNWMMIKFEYEEQLKAKNAY